MRPWISTNLKLTSGGVPRMCRTAETHGHQRSSTGTTRDSNLGHPQADPLRETTS